MLSLKQKIIIGVIIIIFILLILCLYFYYILNENNNTNNLSSNTNEKKIMKEKFYNVVRAVRKLPAPTPVPAPELPMFFTISDSNGNTMKYDKISKSIKLTTKSEDIIEILFSVFKSPRVFNNDKGRIALQNNSVYPDPPTYIRHYYYDLYSNNFADNNNDFAWFFIKDAGSLDTYKITNDYTEANKFNYYLGYDSNSDKVKILPNNNNPLSNMQSWTINDKTQNYLGCFKDDTNRAIQYNLSFPGIEPYQCGILAYKNRYNTFSSQYGGQCWADNNPDYFKYGSAENCETSGGSLTNQVYTTNIKLDFPVLPTFFTISDSFGNMMKYDTINNCIRLKAPESNTIILLKFSAYNDSSVYMQTIGRIGLKNNSVNPPTYISHDNVFLKSSNNFESNNDFAWGFIKNIDSMIDTYKIINDYYKDSDNFNYYIGYDYESSIDIVKIIPNNNKSLSRMKSWIIKEFIQPITTQPITTQPTTTQSITTQPTNTQTIKYANVPETSRRYSSAFTFTTPEIGYITNKTHASQFTKSTISDSDNGWIPGNEKGNEWMELNLTKLTPIRGVVIKGRNTIDYGNQYVTRFKLTYTIDNKKWEDIQNPNPDPLLDNLTFIGFSNRTKSTDSINVFFNTIQVMGIRITPTAASTEYMTIRADLILDDSAFTTTTQPITTPVVAPPVVVAPPITTQPTTTQPPDPRPNIILQKGIVSELEAASSQINSVLILNPTTTMTEKFANIDSKNSIIFNYNSNNPELNNYVNSYNNSIALLEDPNQMTKTAFDTYIYIQNKKINDLKTNLDSLNKNIKNTVSPVKGLKSMYNSKILNVEEYPSPTATNNGMPKTYSGNGAVKYPNYLIYGNNGCLEYNPSSTQKLSSSSSVSPPSSSSASPPSWSFKSCNANNPNQQFITNQINSLDKYNAPITDKNNSSYLLKDSKNTQFGFYVVNPSTANDQCLQLNNDGLSVMPCMMDSSQKFKPSFHSVLE